MRSGLAILIIAAAMLVGTSYSLSSSFLFVEGRIVGGVSCNPQGNGKTYCCASVYEEDENYFGTTYCTTCDDTNPPSNCTPREKPKVVVDPGRDLSNILEGGIQGGSVLEDQTTTTPLEGQRANVTILPGGSIQSEEASNDAENTTATQDNEEMGTDDQNGESESTQKQFSERAGESNDDEASINEELPLE